MLFTQERALTWMLQKFRLKRKLTLITVFQIVSTLVSLQRRARKNTWRHSGEHVHAESDTASVMCEEDPEDDISESLSDQDVDAIGHVVTPELREGERCMYGTPHPCLEMDCGPIPLPGVDNFGAMSGGLTA